MGFTSILRGFAAMLLTMAVAMCAPALVAFAQGEPTGGSYVFGVVAAGMAGAGAYAASIGRRPPTDFRGALIIILLWWVVAPVFAGLPFALQGGGFSDAYFEAVAALTTTGGWLSHEAAIESSAGALWRALLQWLGGLASLAVAAAIFIRPAFIGIDTLLPPFSRGDKDNFLRPLRNAIRSFASVYAVVTMFAFGGLAIAGAPTFDAAIMALSGVASGGFAIGPAGYATYPVPVIIVAAFVMAVGASNFVAIARVVQGASGRVRDIENGAYIGILIFAALLFWILTGADGAAGAVAQIFNAISILSTNGVVIGEAPPLAAALVTAIIGGAAVSTAGGFKILRWLVITRRAREEIRRLVLPSAVFGGARVSNEFGVWIHFLVFTMTLGALVVALSVGGHPFELTAAAAVSALANAGPLIYLAEAGADGYAAISPPYRWFLVAAMILGRLEAAVALALISRSFWRS